jgi:hypothetical protein
MNRRNTLRFAAVAVLGLTLLPGTALAQQKPLKDQLAGTWTIVSNDNVAPDGTKRQLFGPNPRRQRAIRADHGACGSSQLQSEQSFGGHSRGKQSGSTRNYRYVWHLVRR